MRHAALAVLVLVLPLAIAPGAQGADPAALVREFYRSYEAGDDTRGAIAIVMPHASTRLARLFERELACQERTRAICALDFDFLVDAQDFALTDVQTSAAAARGNRVTVTARFRNAGTPVTVLFRLARDGQRWRVDDVEGRHGGRTWVLSRLLADAR
jgi:hypothetical protein